MPITTGIAEAVLQARFDAVDTNHDGIVTRDEVRAARAAHHQPTGLQQH